MAIGTTAALIGLGLSAAGSTAASVYGASKAARASTKAADTQSAAAAEAARANLEASRYATDKQYAASQEALALQRQMYDQGRADYAPWLQTGQNALASLAGRMGELTTPYPQGFDRSKVTMDPGFDFRLAEGQKVLERSAAARGGATSGGALKALTRYGQDFASNEYDRAYGRTLGEFQQGYNIYNQDQANTFNRLAALSGVGQTAASQLAGAGQNYGRAAGDILTGTAANIGNLAMLGQRSASDALMAGANARASGYVGSANAWNQGLGSVANAAGNIPNYLMLMKLLSKPGAAGGSSLSPDQATNWWNMLNAGGTF